MPVSSIYLGYLGAALFEIKQELYGPAIKLVIDPQRTHDPAYIGNALAEAINTALDLNLCGQGMPWQYHLSLLEALPQLPDNLALVLMNADYAPELANAAKELDGVRLYLHCAQTLPSAFATIPYRTLGVAVEVTPNPSKTKEGLLLAFEGQLKRGQTDRALDSLCHLPDQLLPHLDQLAWQMLTEGRVVALFEQLSALPSAYRKHPRVLRWRLSTAIKLWRFDEVLLEVEEALAQGQPDPELLAYHALALHHLGRHDAAKNAIDPIVQQSVGPLILSIAAQIYQDRCLATAQGFLQLALEQVEATNQPLLKARIGVLMSEIACQKLEPDRALHWANWALRVLEQHQINLVPLRIQALLLSTTARLYLGDMMGLEESLRREADGLAGANPRLRNLFDATLAELLMVQGRNLEAVERLRALWLRLRQRESLAMYGPTFVRGLLELGLHSEALRVAQEIETLNQQSHPTYHAKGRLCRLMVEALSNPAGAVEELQQIVEVFHKHEAGYEQLIANLHLARAHQVGGNPKLAQHFMQQLEPVLRRFGKGLRAFIGPDEAFYELLAPYLGQQNLELEFMGAIAARLRGQTLTLPQKQADALAVLALKPEGLTVQQLTLALYGEEGILNSAHKVMARVKGLVPIKANPYTLAVEYSADFLEVKRCLEGGDLRGALRHYKGHLLPLSQSKMIEDERQVLEEMLRTAVLLSGDAEAIYAVATLYRDDLELWESAVGSLSIVDPRRAIAEAQRRTIAKEWNNPLN